MKIVVDRVASDQYIASIDGDPNKDTYGEGKSANEAIGSLIVLYPWLFGLKININGEKK